MNLLAQSQNVYIRKILIAQFGCISVAVSQKMTSSILLVLCICHLYWYHRSKSPMAALPPLCLKKNKQSDVAKNFSVTPHFSWLNVLTHMGHLYYPLVLLRALLFCVERPSCVTGSEKSQPTLWCFITLIVWLTTLFHFVLVGIEPAEQTLSWWSGDKDGKEGVWGERTGQ